MTQGPTMTISNADQIETVTNTNLPPEMEKRGDSFSREDYLQSLFTATRRDAQEQSAPAS
jgi:hypothetical protein